jgi:hypothetical protein
MRTNTLSLIVAVTLTALPTFAGSLNLSTGQNSSGLIYADGGETDANWTATSDPTYDPTGTAQTVFSNDADWYGGWTPNTTSSDWIARNANVTNNGPAPYSFSLTFSLADTTGASISGSWTIDDEGTLTLNGNPVSSLGDGNWGGLTLFSDNNASDFVAGLNTLEITITADDEYLEGVDLTGTLTGDLATSATPEPATWLLMAGGLGLGALGKLRVRKARRP